MCLLCNEERKKIKERKEKKGPKERKKEQVKRKRKETERRKKKEERRKKKEKKEKGERKKRTEKLNSAASTTDHQFVTFYRACSCCSPHCLRLRMDSTDAALSSAIRSQLTKQPELFLHAVSFVDPGLPVCVLSVCVVVVPAAAVLFVLCCFCCCFLLLRGWLVNSTLFPEISNFTHLSFVASGAHSLILARSSSSVWVCSIRAASSMRLASVSCGKVNGYGAC